jgi:hypothetical protein
MQPGEVGTRSARDRHATRRTPNARAHLGLLLDGLLEIVQILVNDAIGTHNRGDHPLEPLETVHRGLVRDQLLLGGHVDPIDVGKAHLRRGRVST